MHATSYFLCKVWLCKYSTPATDASVSTRSGPHACVDTVHQALVKASISLGYKFAALAFAVSYTILASGGVIEMSGPHGLQMAFSLWGILTFFFFVYVAYLSCLTA